MAPSVYRGGAHPTMPTGTEVASYKTYREASAALAKLSDDDFPIAGVTIVGSDLHMVEIVVGKLTPARVAFAGASQGLTWGLLFGLMLLFIIRDVTPLVPILAVVGGITAGILMSVIMWSSSRERKSYMSQSQMVATRYAVLVAEQTDRAFKLLQNTPGNLNSAPKTRTRRHTSGPTEFGSRPDEKPKFGVRLSPGDRAAREREETQRPPAADSAQPEAAKKDD